MNLDLFLFAPSFQGETGTSVKYIEEKIENALILIEHIRTTGDTFSKGDDVYEVEIVSGANVLDIVYGGNNSLSRDHKKALQKIVEYSVTQTQSSEDVLETIEEHNANNLRGLFCLNPVSHTGIEIYFVKDKLSWLKLRRFFLGNYPGSVSDFAQELPNSFPDLIFHEKIVETLGTLTPPLPSVCKQVIFNLQALNDEFRKYHNKVNRYESLKTFSAACSVDATHEGDAKRKNDFDFTFKEKIGDETISEVICCEPHLKISASDNPGDKHFYYNRIYFHEGKESIFQGKIVVGHIGEHL